MPTVVDERKRIERELARQVGRCIADYDLIRAGDRIMVCLSGGKDSYAMLSLLRRFQRRAPIRFELVAVHLDQGQPGYDGTPLERWLAVQGVEHRILHEDTYSVVVRNVPEGRTYCSACSRLRRGVLYNAAQELGCTKIALGHHRDDALETLLLNLMYAGTLASMPPKLVSDDGRNVVIRPLMLCAEETIASYARACEFPILPCNLCSSQDGLKRQEVKRWLGELEQRVPNLRQTMLGALTRVRPSQLADAGLWSALGLPVADAALADELPGEPSRITTRGFSLSSARKRLPLLAE